jgi:hypothetical protein
VAMRQFGMRHSADTSTYCGDPYRIFVLAQLWFDPDGLPRGRCAVN